MARKQRPAEILWLGSHASWWCIDGDHWSIVERVADQTLEHLLSTKEKEQQVIELLGWLNMGKVNDPKDFGRDEAYTLQCSDPETRVIFEVSRTVMEE